MGERSANRQAAAGLSTRLDDPDARPYFLWDEPMTVGQIRQRLATASRSESTRLLAKILREARDPDVWAFTTPDEVAARWEALERHLGRRREFWKMLLEHWARQGRLHRGWPR